MREHRRSLYGREPRVRHLSTALLAALAAGLAAAIAPLGSVGSEAGLGSPPPSTTGPGGANVYGLYPQDNWVKLDGPSGSPIPGASDAEVLGSLAVPVPLDNGSTVLVQLDLLAGKLLRASAGMPPGVQWDDVLFSLNTGEAAVYSEGSVEMVIPRGAAIVRQLSDDELSSLMGYVWGAAQGASASNRPLAAAHLWGLAARQVEDYADTVYVTVSHPGLGGPSVERDELTTAQAPYPYDPASAAPYFRARECWELNRGGWHDAASQKVDEVRHALADSSLDPVSRMASEYILGGLLVEWGRVDDAIDLAELSLRSAESYTLDRAARIYAYGRLASLLMARGVPRDYARAEEALARVSDLAGGDPAVVSLYYGSMGHLMHLRGDREGARSWYRKQLDLIAAESLPPDPETLVGIGDLSAPSSPRRALDYYEKALSLYRPSGGNLWCCLAAAEAATELKEHSRAASLLEEAARLQDAPGDLSMEAASDRVLLGDSPSAQRYRSELPWASVVGSRYRAAALARLRAGAQAQRQGNVPEARREFLLALEDAERSRARVLRRLIMDGAAQRVIESRPATGEEGQGAAIDDASGDANRPEREITREVLRELVDRLETLVTGWTAHAQASAESYRSLLDADTIVFSYLVDDEAIHLLTLGKGDADTAHYRLEANEGDAAQALHDLLAAGGAPGPSPFAQSLLNGRLWELLIGPAAERLAGKSRLVIIPDGEIAHVPFAGLCPRLGEAPLVRSVAVVKLPSLAILATLRAYGGGGSSNSPSVLVAGSPVYPERGAQTSLLRRSAWGERRADIEQSIRRGKLPLEPLPYAEREALEVGQALGDPGGVLLHGHATRQAVISALARASVIHLACHSYTNDAYPFDSGAIMTVEGNEPFIVTAEDFLNEGPLRADQVVLASCSSSLGPIAGGEGVLGLPSSILAAGARSVISTLWAVPDESAARLMPQYYGNLPKHDKAEALRLAQVALAETGAGRQGGIDHWAQYELWGDWLVADATLYDPSLKAAIPTRGPEAASPDLPPAEAPTPDYPIHDLARWSGYLALTLVILALWWAMSKRRHMRSGGRHQ